MAKMSPEALRENFKESVIYVWEVWRNYTHSKADPFKDSDALLETDIDNDGLRFFNASLFYAKGVHDATGWSLHDPSQPKEWGPDNK